MIAVAHKYQRIILVCCLVFFHVAQCQAATLDEMFQQAQAAFKSGDYNAAGVLFEQAGTAMQKQGDIPKAVLLWGNSAVALMKAENYEAAANTYEQILSAAKTLSQEESIRIYKNLARCRANLNQRALQIYALERLLKAQPKLPPQELSDIYAMQGDAYRALELYRPAASSYDKAIALLPAGLAPEAGAKMRTALGLCLGNLGDYETAIRHLVNVRTQLKDASQPQLLAEANSNLGIILWEKGDYSEAIKLIDEALALEVKANLRRIEGVDRNNIGLVYKSSGKYQNSLNYISESLAIAQEVGNSRDEGIALVNRALIYRIIGKTTDAREDYKAALALFEKSNFQEGKAGALLGIGKIAELEDRNYTLALQHYENALEIYEKLHLARGHAESLLQIAGIYKRMIAPSRASRDLVFDDSPLAPDITTEAAIAQAAKLYAQALNESQLLNSKEMVWSALQGVGYVALREGKLEEAYTRYMEAIAIITKLYISLDSVEMLGEYMAGKEDIFGEAQEVCAALYTKTGNKKFLDTQLQLSETMRNEIQKASSTLVQMQFNDVKKQALYEKINKLGRAQAKAVKAMPSTGQAAASTQGEKTAEDALSKKAAAEQKATVNKLDLEYAALIADWKKQYPQDAVIFDSSSRVDVQSIQKSIFADQIVLQYITLPDKLLILAISKENIACTSVDISKKNIEKLVREDFLVGYIEDYARKPTNHAQNLQKVCSTLSQLYTYLIRPVEESLASKKRIYIISDGYLAQTPFGALVEEMRNGTPTFLIEKFDIGYLRPSFANAISRPAKPGSVKKMLAIANPLNSNFQMGTLPGTIAEISNANAIIKAPQIEKTISFETTENDITPDTAKKLFPELTSPPDSPTEPWLKQQLLSNRYEIVYFATHGMPYSDTYKSLLDFERAVKKGRTLSPKIVKIKRTAENSLASLSPLNGFLYLSSVKGDDIMEGEIPTSQDGLLTMKEVLELPDEYFMNTKYLILSACNTGVSFAPKALLDNDTTNAFSSKDVQKIIADAGWVPGVDQVSFVETFMRKGITNVYGTFWFADDASSAVLMSNFIQNLVAHGEHPDAVVAFSAAQRAFVTQAKAGEKVIPDTAMPYHPCFWAVGAIFGK